MQGRRNALRRQLKHWRGKQLFVNNGLFAHNPPTPLQPCSHYMNPNIGESSSYRYNNNQKLTCCSSIVQFLMYIQDYTCYMTDYIYLGFTCSSNALQGIYSCQVYPLHLGRGKQFWRKKMPCLGAFTCTKWDLNPQPSGCMYTWVESTNHYTTVLPCDRCF